MHICSSPNRSPIHCFIPPYVLDKIAQNGTPDQQAWANVTQMTSSAMRVDREMAKGGKLSGDTAFEVTGPAVKQRYVYTANNGTSLPGVIVRSEGEPACGDPAVDEAYDGSGYTYDLFWDVYQRNSIDNRGMNLISTVHYQRNYDNAFWNGSQMVYGDGDDELPPAEQLFHRFTIALDVIAHELTHGITQYEANLIYSNQPGALNESVSDVFGVLVKQSYLRQTARQASWIIGEGLFTSNINGVGIRSMKAPGTAYDDALLGKDPQPAHMKDYVNTISDNGGVHINSGIPNHAFYVTAYELDGFAWEKAGRIWYKALTDHFTSTSNFQEAANITYQVAGEMFGANSLEQKAVVKGWNEVGIAVAEETKPDDGQSTGCLPALLLKLFGPSNSSK